MRERGSTTIEAALVISVVILVTVAFTTRAVRDMYASGAGSVMYYVDMNHAYGEDMVENGEDSPLSGMKGDIQTTRGILSDKFTSVRNCGDSEIRNELKVRRAHMSFLAGQAVSDEIADFIEFDETGGVKDGGDSDEDVR